MAESEKSSGTRAGWKDDPLSVFLAIAAVILGGMYLLEQQDVAQLEEASATAQTLAASTLNLEGCTLGSASTGGRTLVVACPTTAEAAAARASSRTPDLSAFDSVVFVGNDLHLVCPTQPNKWPAECEQRDKPPSKAL